MPEWDRVFNVNLRGPLLCTQAVVDSMTSRGGGRIVNGLSAGAFMAGGIYGVSKLALHSLTANLATELGSRNINVNAIAPGLIESVSGFASLPKESPMRSGPGRVHPWPEVRAAGGSGGHVAPVVLGGRTLDHGTVVLGRRRLDHAPVATFSEGDEEMQQADRKEGDVQMPRFHHVNLGVPPDVVESETDFLVSILDYRPLEIPPEMQQYDPKWFEADDGTQVHLSVDPDHRPAARAHTAIELSDQATEVERRLPRCRAGPPDGRDRRGPHALLPGPSGQPLGATSREATSTAVVQHRRSSVCSTETDATAGNAPLPLGVVWQRLRSPASGARSRSLRGGREPPRRTDRGVRGARSPNPPASEAVPRGR